MSVPAFSSASNNFPVQTHRQKWFRNLLLFLCRLDNNNNNNEGIKVSLSYTKGAIIDLLRRFVWQKEDNNFDDSRKNPSHYHLINFLFHHTQGKRDIPRASSETKRTSPGMSWKTFLPMTELIMDPDKKPTVRNTPDNTFLATVSVILDISLNLHNPHLHYKPLHINWGSQPCLASNQSIGRSFLQFSPYKATLT